MPRSLPWLQDAKAPSRPAPATGNPKTKPKPGGAAAPRNDAPPNDAPPNDASLNDAPPNDAAAKRRHAAAAALNDTRDSLVKIGFMTPEDDWWIMVEDEFLSTAQLFTRSVHQKEYERLRREAASKNASQISSIKRPVTTSARSKETLRRREIAAKEHLLLRQSLALRKRPPTDDSSDDEDELDPKSAWANSELRTLMRTRTEAEASLGTLLRRRPVATRAAAGYTGSQATAGRGPPLLAIEIKPTAKPSPPPLPQPAACAEDEEDDDLDAPFVNDRKASAEPALTTAPRATTVLNFDDDDDDDDIFPLLVKPSAKRFRGKSTAARERALKREQAGTAEV